MISSSASISGDGSGRALPLMQSRVAIRSCTEPAIGNLDSRGASSPTYHGSLLPNPDCNNSEEAA